MPANKPAQEWNKREAVRSVDDHLADWGFVSCFGDNKHVIADDCGNDSKQENAGDLSPFHFLHPRRSDKKSV